MESIAIAGACLGVANGAITGVEKILRKHEQWSDSSFNIICLHSDLGNAKTCLAKITEIIGPRLASASPDVVTTIKKSFSACQLALETIQSDVEALKAESRRDRAKLVWNQRHCENTQKQLNGQIDGLWRLVQVAGLNLPQQQLSAIVNPRQSQSIVSDNQLIDTAFEDSSGDDNPTNPLLGSLSSRNPTEHPTRPARRWQPFGPSKKASRALIQAALIGDVTEMGQQYKDADVNYKSKKKPHPDNDGMTALHAAAKGGHYRAVDFLIESKADVNAFMVNNFTPLHQAASAQHTEVVQRLIDGGANVNIPNAQGRTPLFKSGGQIAKLLLKAHADPHVKDNEVNTPLHCAASDNYLEAVRLLTQAGANVDTRNLEGKTALWLVCDRTNEFNLNSSLEIVDLLLQRKAGPNIACQQGKPPLQLCIQQDRLRLVERLVNAGANATFRTNEGDTLLHRAAQLQSAEILCVLLPQFGSIDTPTEGKRYSPLHLAVQQGSYLCTRALLERGASVTVQDSTRSTALHYAAKASIHKNVKILLEMRADIHATDIHHRTPLFYAERSLAVAQRLVKAGALLTVRDTGGNSPLHHLVCVGDPTVVTLLLESGSSVTTVNKDGRTPLEELCEYEWSRQYVSLSRPFFRPLETYRLLLKHGAVVTPKCRASIALWPNDKLRNAITSELPWRWPWQVVAENPTLQTVGMGVLVAGTAIVGIDRNMRR